MIGNSNGETPFRNKLLLTDKQAANPCKAFAKNTSTNNKIIIKYIKNK